MDSIEIVYESWNGNDRTVEHSKKFHENVTMLSDF
jgi:hypothetical protein